jgi:hypothetical protein
VRESIERRLAELKKEIAALEQDRAAHGDRVARDGVADGTKVPVESRARRAAVAKVRSERQ